MTLIIYIAVPACFNSDHNQERSFQDRKDEVFMDSSHDFGAVATVDPCFTLGTHLFAKCYYRTGLASML